MKPPLPSNRHGAHQHPERHVQPRHADHFLYDVILPTLTKHVLGGLLGFTDFWPAELLARLRVIVLAVVEQLGPFLFLSPGLKVVLKSLAENSVGKFSLTMAKRGLKFS